MRCADTPAAPASCRGRAGASTSPTRRSPVPSNTWSSRPLDKRCARRAARPPASARAPVDLDRLERREIDPVEAADVDRRELRPRRALAERERGRAARRAESVLDRVPVERVRRELLLAALEAHAFARHEPEEIPLAAAMRAVAVDDPIDLAFDLVRDLAAVAAP